MPYKDPARNAECQRRWKERNKERIAESNRRRYERNKARILARNKEWQRANRPKRNEHWRRWAAKNKASIAEQRRRRRADPATADAANAAWRKWIENNPEKQRAKSRNRRSAQGSHTAEDVKAQLRRQRGKCFYCHVLVGNDYHVDHVTPLARGGRNSRENLVIACQLCNLTKGAKDPQDFAGILL